jgi:hypothetical protein
MAAAISCMRSEPGDSLRIHWIDQIPYPSAAKAQRTAKIVPSIQTDSYVVV